jgi:hypothetical protein
MPHDDQSKGSDSQEISDASVASHVTYEFNRQESPTQTPADAVLQQASREIWGRPAQFSNIPAVKAYREAKLSFASRGGRGVLFNTAVAPTRGSGSPFEARWYQGTPGVMQKPNSCVAIRVTDFLNLQP